MRWTESQEALAERLVGDGKPSTCHLSKIPPAERKYKCHTCHAIINAKDLVPLPEGHKGEETVEVPGLKDPVTYPLYGICPECGESHVVIMCPLDHHRCNHLTMAGIDYCIVCGQAICPECGTHDVAQISRVTGYLQDVNGWNEGKRQELLDRHRVNVA